MASLSFDTDTIATGNNVGGGLEVSSLPINDFLASQGVSDTSSAVFVLEFPDEDLEYSDVTGDGAPEYWVASGTQPTAMYIDVNGDGTPDYQVVDPNNNSPMTRDGQSGAHMAKINQSLNFYAYPYDPGNPGPVLGTSGGNMYLATDGQPFSPGEVRAPIDDTTGADNQLIMDASIVCFTRGTLIATPTGQRRVEDLQVGDLVETLDRGAQPIRWIASRRIGGAALALRPDLRPIRIPAGALGDGHPARDLLVSPQHRVVLSSPIIRRMFDQDEVLVPAKLLVGHHGIAAEAAGEVDYFHFILDRHELVWANGALTETMLAGPMALKALGPDQCRELALIFPETAIPTFAPSPHPEAAREQCRPETPRKKPQEPLSNGLGGVGAVADLLSQVPRNKAQHRPSTDPPGSGELPFAAVSGMTAMGGAFAAPADRWFRRSPSQYR